MATTDLGFPYYSGSDSPAGFSQQQALAEAIDAMPGVGSYTQTEIDAFTVVEKRAGRVVFNETTGTHQRSNGSTWTDFILEGDARLANARTPTSHASSHAAAGSDPLTLAQSQVTGLTDALAAKADLAVTINPQADSYTLVLGDAGKQVEMSKSTANNLTVPPNASVAFPVGTEILVVQIGAGQTTIVAGSGVTVNAQYGLKITGQWGAALLVKRATNTWVAIGALGA